MEMRGEERGSLLVRLTAFFIRRPDRASNSKRCFMCRGEAANIPREVFP